MILIFMKEMDWSVLGKMESHGKERKEVHWFVWRKGSKLSLCMIQIFLCWEKQAQGSLSITCMIRTVNTTYSIIGWLIETKMQLLSWGWCIRVISACEWNRCRYPHQPITISHICRVMPKPVKLSIKTEAQRRTTISRSVTWRIVVATTKTGVRDLK